MDPEAIETRLRQFFATDRELVAKRLAQIETWVHELQTLARPEEIRRDVREERFVEHTLQIAIQAALDVAARIVANELMGEARTSRELFELLERHGWIPADLARGLRRLAGFRNILVQSYDDVDLGVVEEIVRHHVDDLLRFVEVVRGKL
jgi:uncharacterized protein YutE (UPF0331/DUF86 family)